MGRPKWADGLEAKGVYFESMFCSTDQRVERHNLETVTSYGTRTSRKAPIVNTPPVMNTLPPTPQLKENVSWTLFIITTLYQHAQARIWVIT